MPSSPIPCRPLRRWGHTTDTPRALLMMGWQLQQWCYLSSCAAPTTTEPTKWCTPKPLQHRLRRRYELRRGHSTFISRPAASREQGRDWMNCVIGQSAAIARLRAASTTTMEAKLLPASADLDHNRVRPAVVGSAA